jgi:hypothetical protein
MSSKTRKQQLQGPRPAPLRVSEGSRKIIKKPVIVYLESPKVIQVRPEEFKGTVQRLTGNHAPVGPEEFQGTVQRFTENQAPVMVAADEATGMGISSDGQQEYHDAGSSAFGMPPLMPFDFAAHPSFYHSMWMEIFAKCSRNFISYTKFYIFF